uniref:Uncharacterized protein n=1 Tax=Vespula pensylvanica TaxID=30213 RepID=A0A834UFC1_VESPE|nr:hypothetical protein H0235_003481 [Vespula pensylvanica]
MEPISINQTRIRSTRLTPVEQSPNSFQFHRLSCLPEVTIWRVALWLRRPNVTQIVVAVLLVDRENISDNKEDDRNAFVLVTEDLC